MDTIITLIHSPNFIASQGILLLAIILDYLSFRSKDKQQILYYLFVSTALFGIHYYLL
jgi:Bacterial inner membrane protein